MKLVSLSCSISNFSCTKSWMLSTCCNIADIQAKPSLFCVPKKSKCKKKRNKHIALSIVFRQNDTKWLLGGRPQQKMLYYNLQLYFWNYISEGFIAAHHYNCPWNKQVRFSTSTRKFNIVVCDISVKWYIITRIWYKLICFGVTYIQIAFIVYSFNSLQ